MIFSSNILTISSPTQIQYTLVTDENSFTDTPFCCWALNLIRTLPNDLMQLNDALFQYEVSFKAHLKKSFEIFSIPDSFFNQPEDVLMSNFLTYSDQFNIGLIKVFIIDSRIKNHLNVSTLIKRLPHSYSIISSELPASPYEPSIEFKKPIQLVHFLKRDLFSVNKSIAEFYGNKEIQINELTINPSKSFLKEDLKYGHPVSANNFQMLNQIVGTNWLKNDLNGEAQAETPPEKRVDELIESTDKIDFIYDTLKTKFHLKPVHAIDPSYSTLIIIAPFHYPLKSKAKEKKQQSKKEKLFNQFLSMEQDSLYQHHSQFDIDKNLTEVEQLVLKSMLFRRTMFLDCAAFMHARFMYSPVIRLPQIGKSINLDLSHINKGFKSEQIESDKIETIGDKLKEHLFDKKIANHIAKRDGQIFAISDLPIEWSKLEDLPLSYTHDVCRMPEFNTNAIINSAIHYQRFNYTIPKNVIDQTLIIHCASEEDEPMHAMFNLIDEFAANYSVTSIKCSTIKEIKTALDKYKPELLIFDCHGGFDSKNLSSFLQLDKQKNVNLTGDDIVSNSISAPLVFLSACNTMPSYGYVKYLSDAFMEAGAYSVTTTFLPLQIIDASTLIIRIISKLDQLKKGTTHGNWLEFISHVLRTTIIHESIKKAQSEEKGIEIDHKKIATILAKTMFFKLRKDALSELNILLIDKFKNAKLDIKSLSNDWLSYSIIGRADLLFFENWVDDFKIKNTPNTEYAT